MSKENAYEPIKPFTRDLSCFACGTQNPFGLHMKFATDQEVVVSEVILPQHLCGWGNMVHGGIISTLLDETMSWTAIHLLKRLILTRTMTIEFILPVAPQTPLRIEGRIESRVKNTSAVVSAILCDAADRICSKGRGEFALISPKMMRRMKMMGDQVIDDFERVYGDS